VKEYASSALLVRMPVATPEVTDTLSPSPSPEVTDTLAPSPTPAVSRVESDRIWKIVLWVLAGLAGAAILGFLIFMIPIMVENARIARSRRKRLEREAYRRRPSDQPQHRSRRNR